jgi:hypothetical protein
VRHVRQGLAGRRGGAVTDKTCCGQRLDDGTVRRCVLVEDHYGDCCDDRGPMDMPSRLWKLALDA